MRGRMHDVAILIFLLTYLGVALGEIPGLALDRTGIALLGALAMVAAGVMDTEAALQAIDLPTVLLLYSLMIVSSQFRLGGFYTRVALGLVRWMDRPRRFLAMLMGVAALLSAVLANDIVCLAFTPVLAVSLLRAGRDPTPYLLGLAIASNVGSAATIIGNPQNMLIGQVGGLHFGAFLLWCLPPSLLALAAAYALLLRLERSALAAAPGPGREAAEDWPAYDPHQSRKGLLVTALLVAMFFTGVPREVSALGAAGILLCSRRMSTRALLGLVDWHLLTLFAGLFIVIGGLSATPAPAWLVARLGAAGIDLHQPYLLGAVSVLLSNLVSNVPASMLLVRFLPAGDPEPWYVLALTSTFAGNLVTIGSIANLIVIEQAKGYGVDITFRRHARTGVPVTLATLAVVYAWIACMR